MTEHSATKTSTFSPKLNILNANKRKYQFIGGFGVLIRGLFSSPSLENR